MILDEIVEHKKNVITKQKKDLSLNSFIDDLDESENDFKTVLRSGRGISLIAEVKKKSPSRGMINESLDFDSIINIYNDHPLVKAISFLTDEKYFGGSLDKMKSIRNKTDKPILRKDFIVDSYQIYQARYYGADAILLIARLLSQEQLSDYIQLARELGMDALVEIHNEQEIKKLPRNTAIVGINNRNLDNMEIDLKHTQRLAPKVKNIADVVVTESGVLNSPDLNFVKDYADAVLIGSAIMAEENPVQKINTLFCPKIKICGITREEDAIYAAANGADYLGFIFYEKSDRYINPDRAKNIIKKVNQKYTKIKIVGVFVNESLQEARKIRSKCNLDFVQLHGDESSQYVEKLGHNTIKAIQVKKEIDLKSEINKYNTDYILLDTFDKNKYGGTGEKFDWSMLDQIQNKDIFLAGGIGPDNFKEAISYQTYAIDINSGVEDQPGQKSKDKMQKILRVKNE